LIIFATFFLLIRNGGIGYFSIKGNHFDTSPSSLMDSTASPKVKTTEGKGIKARSLIHITSRVEGRAGAPGWD
jgi:hypothetical protein